MKKTYNWLNIIQNYLLPPTCIVCGHASNNERDLCNYCYQQLPLNTHYCSYCATSLTASVLICGRCQRSPPAFDGVFAPFLYQDALCRLIIDLKFQQNYKNARLLGSLLAGQLTKDTLLPDCLLAVPLSKSRYRQRGFNQSLEIARTVAKQLQLPLDFSSCIRHRDTLQQMTLNVEQRQKNVIDAFSVTKPFHNQHIVLIDDVMTTGSTVNEIANVLKKAGAKRVDVWVCARA